MTGACAAANRWSRAVRATIPGRAPGGWNFGSDRPKPGPAAVPWSLPDITWDTTMTSGLILQNVLQDQYKHH